MGSSLVGRGKKRGMAMIAALACLLGAAFLISFTQGKYPLTLDETLHIISHYLFGGEAAYAHASETVFLRVRLPRLCACVFVGAALSAAGAVYQGIFRNPMASPDLLGASSGASLGACCAILVGAPALAMHMTAFAMGLAAVGLTFLVSRLVDRRGNQTLTLVLTGMVVSSLLNAGVSITKTLADTDDKLGEITFWLMGSMTHMTLDTLPVLILPILLGLIPIVLLRYKLNVLSFGDDEARTMGLNAPALRGVLIVCSTLLTSASVAACGMVGWVGLLIPHLIRMIVGPDYRYLIPGSMLAGALFLLLVDNISRVFCQVEISIGILTALIGAPFFLILLARGRKGWL